MTRTTDARSRRVCRATAAAGLSATLAAGLATGLPAAPATADGADHDTQLVAPVLRRHLDLSAHVRPDLVRMQLQVGDLDGDGRHSDFVRYSNSRLQAFQYRGGRHVELLWEWSAGVELPRPPDRYHYKHTVFDVDGDGQDEVIGPFPTPGGAIELRVVDGRTGHVEHAVDTGLPNPLSDDREEEWRIDAVVADVRGTGRPSDVVLGTEFDSNGDWFVFTDELVPLWDTTGDNANGPGGKDKIYAHFPHVGDLDGDGREELVGSWLIDDDGSRGYRVTPPEWEPEDFFYDHLDRAFLGDLDPDRPGLELLASHEQNSGLLLDGATGEPYWSLPNGFDDSKIAAVGEFLPENPGIEILTRDPEDEDRHLVLDIDGRVVGTVSRIVDGTDNALVDYPNDWGDGYPIDWDGDRRVDEVFEPRNAVVVSVAEDRALVLADHYLADARTPLGPDQRLYSFPVDLVGDHREEILVWDEDELLVYGAEGRARDRHPSPWRDPEYARAVAETQNDTHPERRWFDWRQVRPGRP
ncbi:MAG: hypothetical protein ACFCVG_00450 [Kineosporiaceae bacterium]